MTRFQLLIALFVLVMTISAAQAAQTGARTPSVEETAYSFGPVAGVLRGHTTYHISAYSGASGIESELEFPLRTTLAGVAGEYVVANYRDGNEWRLRARVLKNVSGGSGVLKDSDWATDDVDIADVGAAHPGKDIYSESDITLDATSIDASLRYTIVRDDRLSYGPVLRLAYQKFNYTASNTNQVGYGPYSVYTAFIPGRTLEYEVTYKILAMGMHVEYPAGGKVRGSFEAAFAPLVLANDRDDHVLRYKLSTGDADGTALLASAELHWDAARNVTVSLGGEYRRIRTSGRQTQYFYAGPNAGLSFSINDRIESDQVFVSAMVTFPFAP